MSDGPWRGRTELTFGRMHEDSAIELAAFPPGSRVFCIASAGCMAFALASAGHRVTAVDINPRQIEYARERAGGAPPVDGAAERMLARARRLLPAIGWSEAKRRAFLELADTRAQLEYWDRELDGRVWRWAVRVFLSPLVLGRGYAGAFLGALPPRFDLVLRGRLRRGWAMHPNRSNPYARQLLLGESPDGPKGPVEFRCADAAEYLEQCAAGSFDAFSLSNIGDAAPAEYIRRLEAAVRRAGSPGAVVVRRSFGEGDPGQAARDRSPIWGLVDVRRVKED